jgi:hypothetical protein
MNMYLLNKIIPKGLNPFSALSEVGKIKGYVSQAKLAAFIIGGILIAILIALTILIIKKTKKK